MIKIGVSIMKNKINETKTKICIPKGVFGGNCSGCRYWEEYNSRALR